MAVDMPIDHVWDFPPAELHSVNRLVAAHVLGWTYRPRFRNDTDGYFGAVISEELPDFAGDIGAAWLVVERLLALGWTDMSFWHVELSLGQAERYCWACGCTLGHREIEAATHALPRAICLAALDALEVPGWKRVAS